MFANDDLWFVVVLTRLLINCCVMFSSMGLVNYVARPASVSLFIPKSGFMYSKRRYLNTIYGRYCDTQLRIRTPKKRYLNTTKAVFRYPIVVIEFKFPPKSQVL